MQTVLVNVLLSVYSLFGIFSIVLLITEIADERKRAKRDAVREARDIEYHEARMKGFK